MRVSSAIAAVLLSIIMIAEARAENLLQNSGFVSDLSDWSIGCSIWDANGFLDAGSALSTAITSCFIFQCVPLDGDVSYEFGVYANPPLSGSMTLRIDWFEFPLSDCAGESFSPIRSDSIVGPAQGVWQQLGGSDTSRAGAVSAMILLSVQNTSTQDDVMVFFDNVFLRGPMIFSDGFESGDPTVRSSRVSGAAG